MPSRFETVKGRRLGLALVVLAGVGVFYPAVRSPLFLDDYLHAAMVEGTFAGKRGPFDLYDFVDDGDRAALAAHGLLPWWSHPHLTIRFFRPLSSALLWSTHRLFGHDALPMHLHSLVWWLAAVLAVRALFRRFFSERVAFIATAVFALSPCHALPLSWVANSETLVALTFGAVALSHYLRFRGIDRAELGSSSKPRWVDGVLAALFFTLSLLGGGEYALAFGGYVLACEVALRKRLAASPLDRLLDHARGFVPFALPAGAYLAARSALHYGAVGSGFYSDPLRDPFAFLRTAPYRIVALLADSWLTIGSDTWRSTWERWALAGIVLAIGVALVFPIRRTVAVLAPGPSVTARAFLWGSLLALAPTLAVVPAFRLLGISMIGVSAMTALVLEQAWFSPEAEASRREPPPRAAALGTLAAIVLAFTQLVHGPVLANLASRVHRRDGREFALRAAWTRDHVGDPLRADVGIIRGIAGTFFTPFALDPLGRPPAQWRVLSHGGHVLALRPDARTVELVFAANRGIYPMGEQNLYRDPKSPLKAGDVIRAPGMTVTILEVGTAGPRRVRFVFDDVPTATTWIADNFDATVPIDLPPVGQGKPFDP